MCGQLRQSALLAIAIESPDRHTKDSCGRVLAILRPMNDIDRRRCQTTKCCSPSKCFSQGSRMCGCKKRLTQASGLRLEPNEVTVYQGAYEQNLYTLANSATAPSQASVGRHIQDPSLCGIDPLETNTTVRAHKCGSNKNVRSNLIASGRR